MSKHMLVKNSQTTNNRDTMNTDQTPLEWETSNVKGRNLILNMANSNFNDFYL